MSSDSIAEFSTRLFILFKSNQKTSASFSRITITKKDQTETVPGLVPVEQNKSTLSSLHMLHPQVRRFLNPSEHHSVKFFSLNPALSDEMRRAAWKLPVAKWAVDLLGDIIQEDDSQKYMLFRISDIEAYVFPSHIIALSLKIVPGFNLRHEHAAAAGKVLINSLNRAGEVFYGEAFKSVPFERVFKDVRQQESIARRMGANTENAFVNGLCGQKISIGDIVRSLVGNDVESLMGDRYVSYSFINTPWSGSGDPFSSVDYVNLVRLARGESDHYLPDTRACRPGSNGIVHTFENVVFCLSGEGICCWVRPGPDQLFLQNQFKIRYDNIYLQLFLLAVHQRYALVDMAKRLDEATPSLDMLKSLSQAGGDEQIERLSTTSDELTDLRAEVANFYLRDFHQQPSVLTNHHEFYGHLQEVLGIRALLEEVQHATGELEFLISSLHERIAEKADKQTRIEQQTEHNRLLSKISNLIHEQERSAHNELTLTLVVEGIAIPYYLFMFLEHAFHCPAWLATTIALSTTAVTMGYTLLKLKK